MMDKWSIRHLFRSITLITLIMTVLLATSVPARAQFQHKLFTSNMMVEGKIHYGFLYAHHLTLEIFNAHFPAFELSISQQTYGKHKWERAFGYPVTGASLFYSDLGNDPMLGQAIALMPFIHFPLVRSRDLSFGFRFALGVGYLTKRFDRIENYKNLAIGSHFNAAVNLMFELRYRISYSLTATGGISLQHFSNGSLKLPNYGINAPLINLGLAYRPVKKNKLIGDRFFPPVEPFEIIPKRSFEISFGFAFGFKDMSAIYGTSYFVTHLYENTLLTLSRKSKAGLGFDLSFDPSQLKLLEMNGDTVENRFSIVRPGINIAYELVLGKLGFLANLGYYLGGREKSNGPLYEKFALQYNFSRNFFAHVFLKVHWGRADYIGWGLGYKFDVYYARKKTH